MSTAELPEPVVASGPVAKPGLIVYSFAPAGIDDEEEARAVAAALARRCRAYVALGIDQPIDPFPPFPEELEQRLTEEVQRPPAFVEPAAEVLAAARRADDVQAYEAFLFRLQDSLGLVAQLAPNVESDSLERWQQLGREASAALAADDEVDVLLGEATVYSALLPERADPAALSARLAPVLGGTGSADLVEPEIVLWETPRDPARPRLLATLAPREREDDLDRLIWWDPANEGGLAPLVRYLLHAAKLRYELRVLRNGIPELRAAKRAVEQRTETLLEQQERLPDRGTVRVESMLSAQVELAAAQTESAGLLRSITRLRELRQAGRIAFQNMGAALDGRTRTEDDAGAGPLARDREIGAWLDDQVEYELGYLQAAKDRADEAKTLTTLRLQYTTDARARLQNQLTLFQASLVGGLLAALGVIQALDPDLRLDRHLDMPLALLIAAFVFSVPLVVVNWFEPYGWLERVAGALLGAAAGWVILRWLAGPTALGWELLAGAAGVCALLAALAAVDAVAGRRGAR